MVNTPGTRAGLRACSWRRLGELEPLWLSMTRKAAAWTVQQSTSQSANSQPESIAFGHEMHLAMKRISCKVALDVPQTIDQGPVQQVCGSQQVTTAW